MRSEAGSNWRDARRRHIVEAADRVFASTSFERAAMDEIAIEAGVGKPTLYRYFATKELLFLAVFETALDRLDAEIGATCRGDSTALDRLAAVIGLLVPFFRRQFATWRDLGDSVEQSRRQLFRQRRSAIENRIAELLEAGELDGTFRPGAGRMAAGVLIGAVWGGATAVDSPDATLAISITDLFVRGLGHHDATPPHANEMSGPTTRRQSPERRLI